MYRQHAKDDSDINKINITVPNSVAAQVSAIITFCADCPENYFSRQLGARWAALCIELLVCFGCIFSLPVAKTSRES